MVSLEERIGYQFKNSTLLVEALTHPSLGFESNVAQPDNQRLEFLGDAVIELALTSKLYELFPNKPEGDLTKMRSRLVSKIALSEFAKNIELGAYVRLGKGEEATGGRERLSTLADAFEAVIGAIYLDAGYDVVREVLLPIVEPSLIGINQNPDQKNPKGALQEILQSIIPESPVYKVLNSSGPDHNKKFNISVSWRGRELAKGIGFNKKSAEADAAKNAMAIKEWEQWGA